MHRLRELLAWISAPLARALGGGGEAPAPSAEPPLVDTPNRWEPFYRELNRARRHERPFAIAKIPVGTVAAADQADVAADAMEHGHVDEVAASRLRESVRTTDEVWVDGDSAFVLMPESGHDDALAALPRALGDRELAEEEIRVASFPDDGVTSGAVLAALLRPDEEHAELTSIAGGVATGRDDDARRREAG